MMKTLFLARYLVDDVHKLLEQDPKLIHVHIERVNPAPTPIQFCLLYNMITELPTDFRPFSSQKYQLIVNINPIQEN